MSSTRSGNALEYRVLIRGFWPRAKVDRAPVDLQCRKGISAPLVEFSLSFSNLTSWEEDQGKVKYLDYRCLAVKSRARGEFIF